MPSYRLSYFQNKGAAENARMLFKIARVDFEDIRYTQEQWQSKKAGTPLGAMPLLEIDGKMFCQGNAIARYLAKQFGLMGANLIEEFFVDELLEVLAEIINRHLMKIFTEKDEAKKKEFVEEFVKDKLPVYLNFIEKRLKENKTGSGFYVGKSITLGDVALHNLLFLIEPWFKKYTTYEGRPLIVAHSNKVSSYPQIAEWIKVRPETEF